MKLSVQNKAVALLAGVVVLAVALAVFALATLHSANDAVHQAAADATAATSASSGEIGALASASQSRFTLGVAVILVLAAALVAAGDRRCDPAGAPHQAGDAIDRVGRAGDLQRRDHRAARRGGQRPRTMGSSSKRSSRWSTTCAAPHNSPRRWRPATSAPRSRPRSAQDALGNSLAAITGTLRQLTKENDQLHAKDRDREMTDALTGLPNRRALMRDLEASLEHIDQCPDLTLVLLDLNGFKPYNDAFSHGAGDALLVRLAERLRRALDGSSACYRMGGDEFCVLASASERAGNAVARRAAKALSEQGEAFTVSCSFGIAFLPNEVQTATDALRLADKRMYEQKMAQASVSRESTTVLLKMLGERNPDVIERTSEVAELAVATAQEIGLPETEVLRIELAAKLRDVGTSAIPDMILNKPGPLDDEEWVFMRRHTQIGARIISAAPSLAGAADLIRSHHEWYDGHGYPDHLAGDSIPIGAQIIAVCDAFGAMTSHRPYRSARNEQEALDELTRSAGTQFSPVIVRTFAKVLSHRGQSSFAVPAPDRIMLARRRHRDGVFNQD